jgi:hypothetical protein
MFLTAANINLVNSSYLLIHGFLTASGHLLRQFGECVAMAMLCTDRDSKVFEELEKLGDRYPIHRVMSKFDNPKVIARLARILGLQLDDWRRFRELTSFYSRFSHATSLSMASMVSFAAGGNLIMGPDFDAGKRVAISSELKRRRSAAATVPSLVTVIDRTVRRTA